MKDNINECVAWDDGLNDVCGRKVGKFYLIPEGFPSKLDEPGPTAVAMCEFHSGGVTRYWREVGTRHMEMMAEEFRNWWMMAEVMQA